MQGEYSKECDQLIDYLTGEGTKAEREAYERHLASCPSCRKELDELKEVWVSMPMLQNEDVEVPGDLKEEVMRGIFGREEEETYGAVPAYGASQVPAKTRRRVPLWLTYAATAAVAGAAAWLLFAGTQEPGARIAIAPEPAVSAAPSGRSGSAGATPVPSGQSGTGTGASATPSGQQGTGAAASPAPSGQPAIGPMQVVRSVPLRPVDASMPNAQGNAVVLERDGRNEILVQLQGLLPTKGEQAYQVWLINTDGSRFNCGTLVTNDQGSGVLTYYVRKENLAFAGIGVTLEPDAAGTQPRGKKVLGTS